VWITEGEIKADLSAERLGAVVVSIPGVELWSRALPDLEELLPHGGRVVVALDADWREKPRVHNAFFNILLACTTLGYETEAALWDVRSGKGLDDLLINGDRPEIHPAAAIPAPRWEMKLTSQMLSELPATTPEMTGVSLHDLRQKTPTAYAEKFLCLRCA
jgi:hypothetical protein